MIKLLQAIVNRMYAVLFTWHPLGIDFGLAGMAAGVGSSGLAATPHDFSESWGVNPTLISC